MLLATGSSTRRRPSAGARSTTACLDWTARMTPLEQIEAPTLVVHGDADRILPFENGVELARRISGSRLERFQGGGHLLFLESPERFNPLVAGFLSLSHVLCVLHPSLRARVYVRASTRCTLREGCDEGRSLPVRVKGRRGGDRRTPLWS